VEAARALLDRLGPGALVVVDDAHLADPGSLQALASAAGAGRAVGFLVLLVVRSGDRRTPPGSVRLLDQVAGETVTVPGLSADEVAALATCRGRPLAPAVADRLCRHADGLPRHVVDLLDEADPELWRSGDAVLPATARVRDEVRVLWEACGSGARSLVEAAAVLADSDGASDLVEVARLAGTDDPLPALEEATTLGLLAATERHGVTVVKLPGQLLAAAVTEVLGPVGLADLHRAAAGIVDDRLRRVEHLAAAASLPDAALADDLDAAAAECASVGAWSAEHGPGQP
jgi:hypothetical protein